MSRRPFDLSLYLVLGEADVPPHGLERVVAAAVAGGVSLVQLREKQADDRRLAALVRALQPLLASAGVPLIVNDRVEAAVALDADGVHVGQGDTPAAEARARIGPERILGLSAHRPEQVRDLPAGLVDYLGVGPMFAARSKADARAPIGAAGIAALRAASPLPIVAIGGLTAEHAPAAIAAGADGVAVVSAIAGAADPQAATRALRAAVDGALAARGAGG